jgi:hypothetical protein
VCVLAKQQQQQQQQQWSRQQDDVLGGPRYVSVQVLCCVGFSMHGLSSRRLHADM